MPLAHGLNRREAANGSLLQKSGPKSIVFIRFSSGAWPLAPAGLAARRALAQHVRLPCLQKTKKDVSGLPPLPRPALWAPCCVLARHTVSRAVLLDRRGKLKGAGGKNTTESKYWSPKPGEKTPRQMVVFDVVVFPPALANGLKTDCLPKPGEKPPFGLWCFFHRLGTYVVVFPPATL